MAMNVQNDNWDEEAELNTTINTTPLVDVMLVLLIIFLVTIPVIRKTVPLQLPNARNIATITKPENVALSIRAVNGSCEVYWGMSRVNSGELLQKAVDKLKFEIERQGGPTAPGLELPEVHIRGDVDTPYRCIGGTICTMQQAGFIKVGFSSEPEAGTAVQRL